MSTKDFELEKNFNQLNVNGKDRKINKKRSLLQEMVSLEKKMEALGKKTLPDYKKIMHFRTEQLLMKFIEHNADINKKKINLKEFCMKEGIGENTMRNALKKKTNHTIRKVNPKSNNIQKYQNQIKQLNSRILLEGEGSLNEKELKLLTEIRQNEAKRLESIKSKKNKDRKCYGKDRGGCLESMNEKNDKEIDENIITMLKPKNKLEGDRLVEKQKTAGII
jgi:hypothetical protein